MITFGSGFEQVSLNAATGSNVLGSEVVIAPGSRPWILINITGAPANAYVDIEGSPDDGTTWYTILGQNITSVVNWTVFNQLLNHSGSTRMRARLNSFNGGTSPTATAIIGTYLETAT